jgi:hypothetical protein
LGLSYGFCAASALADRRPSLNALLSRDLEMLDGTGNLSFVRVRSEKIEAHDDPFIVL